MRLQFGFSSLLVCLVALLPFTFHHLQNVAPSSSRYIGDEKCVSCHKEYGSYAGTAHHLTSQPATARTIAGSFTAGKNLLKTSQPELLYRLESKQDGFYQTGVLGTPPDAISISERFDLVIGSGRKGQTYLYWKDNQLFELPVSYWTELASWVNSPGYGDNTLEFSRPVVPRCVECHATYFEQIANSELSNRYNRANHVLGIACEKCHGPGGPHAEINAPGHPKPADQMIVNPAKLSRERQLALCSLCHGGLGVAKAPAFSFTVGKSLEDFIELQIPKPDAYLDPHGNQVALLERSKCFKASQMTCSTCHDVHVRQREVGQFSEKCLTCHKVESCGLFPTRGRSLAGKCVDCHLPNQTSQVISSTHNGVMIRPNVRNHWIKVYERAKG